MESTPAARIRPSTIPRLTPCLRQPFDSVDPKGPPTHGHFRDALSVLRLDKLDRLETRSFDHHGAPVPELVRLLQEFHVVAPELSNPRVEVIHAQRDVI